MATLLADGAAALPQRPSSFLVDLVRSHRGADPSWGSTTRHAENVRTSNSTRVRPTLVWVVHCPGWGHLFFRSMEGRVDAGMQVVWGWGAPGHVTNWRMIRLLRSRLSTSGQERPPHTPRAPSHQHGSSPWKLSAYLGTTILDPASPHPITEADTPPAPRLLTVATRPLDVNHGVPPASPDAGRPEQS